MNELLQNVVSSVSGTLACGVVDLETGLLLGVHHTVPYFTQNYLDAVAAASVDMFRGRNVTRVEEMIANIRGTDAKTHFIEEVFMKTKKTFHFMSVLPEKNAVVVLITSKEVNQGMGWSSLRSALPKISDAIG